jgi:hypothetical protein
MIQTTITIPAWPALCAGSRYTAAGRQHLELQAERSRWSRAGSLPGLVADRLEHRTIGASRHHVQYSIAMRKPLSLAICLLVAPAVLVSGCGSTRTASTNNTASTSASAPAPAPAPATQSTQTVPQSTSSKAAQHASKARKQKEKVAAAKREQQEKVAAAMREQKEKAASAEILQRYQRKLEAARRAAARPGLEAAEARLPVKRRYPKDLQGKFMVLCKAAKGSTSSCECIVVKQELNTRLEMGRTLAELLALEIAFQREGASLEDIRRHRVVSPRVVGRVTRECK